MKKVIIILLNLFILTNMQKKIFAQTNFEFNDIITIDEREKINILMYERLSEKTYEIEILSGLNDKNRYVIAYTNNKYLIFDRNFGIYIEYGETSKNPYKDYIGKYQCIYVGPTNYYYIKNNIFYSIEGNELNIKMINNLFEFEKKYMNYELKENIKAKGLIYENIENKTNYKVDYSFYFENLNSNIGNNQNGTCGFISMSMLFGYYDTILSDTIISNEYEIPGYISTNSPSLCTNSPGTTNSFHLMLVSMYNSSTLSTENNQKYMGVINDYLDSRNIIHNETYITQNSYSIAVNTIVNYKRPVIISIYRPSDIDAHSVIAYAWNQIDGLICHFGYIGSNGSQSQRTINGYIVFECIDVDLSCSHTHSYKYINNNDNKYYCVCGNKICQGTHSLLYSNLNISCHELTCQDCDYYIMETHNFFRLLSGWYKCMECGYITKYIFDPYSIIIL